MGLHSRLQLQELINVALVKRQLGGGALVNDSAKLRRARIDDRGRAGNFDYIRGAAKLQGNVHGEHLVKVQHDSLADIFLETLEREIDFVTSDRHLYKTVFAIRAGLRLAGGVGGLVDQSDVGRRHSAAARICYRPADAAAGALCAREW